jgi:hypothetical protein
MIWMVGTTRGRVPKVFGLRLGPVVRGGAGAFGYGPG